MGLYETINDLRNQLIKEGLSEPFNIFEICDHFDDLEIATCNFTTPGLRGMAAIAKDEYDVNCILVNSNLSKQEQNFHGMHELIHIYTSVPNSGQTFNCFDKIKPNQNSYIEWIANEGAAELILPYKKILPVVKNWLPELHKWLVPVSRLTDVIAETYSVSFSVAKNRLNSLSYEIYQYLNGKDLDDICILSKNQQKQLGIHIDTLSDIETARLLDRMCEHKKPVSTPFFGYAPSYEKSPLASNREVYVNCL